LCPKICSTAALRLYYGADDTISARPCSKLRSARKKIGIYLVAALMWLIACGSMVLFDYAVFVCALSERTNKNN
jgi:hypothetical protein